MPNIYYDPQAFNATLVGMIEQDDLSYEFNMFIVLQHQPSGRVYVANDSGCSCPTPFEGYSRLEDATEVRSLDDYRAALKAWNQPTYRDTPYVGKQDVDALEEKVRTALRRKAAIDGWRK